MSNAIALTTNNFEAEVLKSNIPVLVDFWAPWCGPCRMLGPVVDEIASTYGEKLKVCKVNIDDESDLSSQYNVSSVPTLLVFNKGVQTNQKVGAIPKAEIEKLFKDLI